MIIYNWKCYLNKPQALKLSEVLIQESNSKHTVIVAPPAIYLDALSAQFKNTPLKLCAQHCSTYEDGPYTGEISATQLKTIGCSYVLLGHSERRTHFKEDDQTISQQYKHALSADLIPILCIGEDFSERTTNQTKTVLSQQLSSVLDNNNDQISEYHIAYEPTWAIGSGVEASNEQISEAANMIQTIIKPYQGGKPVHILYGGSVKSANIKAIVGIPNINGALIGGASLKKEEIIQIHQQL